MDGWMDGRMVRLFASALLIVHVISASELLADTSNSMSVDDVPSSPPRLDWTGLDWMAGGQRHSLLNIIVHGIANTVLLKLASLSE